MKAVPLAIAAAVFATAVGLTCISSASQQRVVDANKQKPNMIRTMSFEEMSAYVDKCRSLDNMRYSNDRGTPTCVSRDGKTRITIAWTTGTGN